MFRKTLTAAAIFILAIGFFSGSAFAAAEFKLSNQFPASHHVSKGLELFAEKVAEYSGGKLTVKIFDSAQLFKDTEIVEALQDSLIETGLVPVNKWSGMIPVADVFEMPFVFKDLESPKKFLDAGAGEILDGEFQKKGVKTLFWVDYGYIQFFNNKHPLKSPEDFKGLTMRTFSSGDAETLKALSAAPTVMSSSEMYMALQRGTVDGATTGMPAAVSRKVHEVQKHMTMANYTTAQFVVQSSLDWWNGLPEEDKEVVMKAGADAEAWIRGVIAESEAEAEKVIADAGVEIYSPNDEERAAFVETTESVRKAFVEATGEMGAKLVELALEASK